MGGYRRKVTPQRTGGRRPGFGWPLPFQIIAPVAKRKSNTMPPSLESLAAEIRSLRSLIESAPLLHRKDLARLLGVSERTISRRLALPGFPRPVYDAGRPKWKAGQFAWCKGEDGASA